MTWETWDKEDLGLPKGQAVQRGRGSEPVWRRKLLTGATPLLPTQGREWQQEPGSVT